MRKLGVLTAAAVLAAVLGLSGAALADFEFPFDGDLVAYYPFDDGADPTDNAEGTSALDGDLQNGASFVSGAGDLAPVPGNAKAVSFDADNDVVVVDGSTGALDFGSSDAMTIALWLKAPSDFDAGADLMHILGKRVACGVINYQIAQAPTEGVSFNSGGGLRTTGVDLTAGEYTHVAVTYDGVDTLRIYVNGSQEAIDTGYTLSGDATAADLTIGASGSCTNLFEGLIDEMRIYDVVLDAGDIQTLASAFPGTVEKELVSGPNDRDPGDPIDVDVNPFDDGGVLVLSPDTQRFEFKITITNDGEDGAIDGLKIFDVVGAEFDPDCDAEDGSIDDPLGTAACPANGDDGIDDTGGTGDCTASITPHDSGRKMDPHFILIVLDDLLAGETCEVTVWVNTDENPSSVKKTGPEDDIANSQEKFSPTSCDLVMEPDLFNTFTLNEGLKVFDPDSGIRLLGPIGSLQLTCNFPD